jgi:hypothetical protein
MKHFFHPAAEVELSDAVEFYELQQPGLAAVYRKKSKRPSGRFVNIRSRGRKWIPKRIAA